MMTKFLAAPLLLLVASCASTSADPMPPLTADALVGDWDVALFYDPAAPPSATAMSISAVADGSISGAFYGSPMSEARVSEREGAIAFAAMTEDGSGPYFHSGRLAAPDVIEGQTLSVGRDFLMQWRATRKREAE